METKRCVGRNRPPLGQSVAQHAQPDASLAVSWDRSKLDLELEVVACEGWKRNDAWDATGLLWVNPSPNMRSLTQAWLYPGIDLRSIWSWRSLPVKDGNETMRGTQPASSGSIRRPTCAA